MVSIKHKVTLKTKVAQEETPEAIESPKVTLKRKQPEASVVAEPKPAPTLPKTEPKAKTCISNSSTGKKVKYRKGDWWARCCCYYRWHLLLYQ